LPGFETAAARSLVLQYSELPLRHQTPEYIQITHRTQNIGLYINKNTKTASSTGKQAVVKKKVQN